MNTSSNKPGVGPSKSAILSLTRKFGLAFLLSGLVLSRATYASESFRTNINPALLYYQAFLLAPDVPEADSEYLATQYNWSRPLPGHFGELVGGYDHQFQLALQASQSVEPCDWGIDWTKGPATLLPQLARAKGVALGARYRVAWALQQGLQTEARDDLVATLALGRNISRDGTLISALVQIAIEAITYNIVAENYGKFNPETLRSLLEGFDTAPARGTISTAVGKEKVLFHDWLVNRVLELQAENPTDDAKVMAGLQKILSGMDNKEEGNHDFWAEVNAAAGGTSKGVLKLLREQGELCQKLVEIMALPLSEFELESKQLDHSANPFVSSILPAIQKARRREFKIEVFLAMVRAAAEYKQRGEAGLQAVQDPCGQGPFDFQPFAFEGVQRGFQLKSAYEGSGFPEALIFVEKAGPPFLIDGPHVGQARTRPAASK